MNIVFAKHNGNDNTYAFLVPDSMADSIFKGTDILVQTKSGLAMAKAITGVISGNGALDLARQNGAYDPIKPVVMVVSPEMYSAIYKLAKYDILKTIQAALAERVKKTTPCPPCDGAGYRF